MKRTIAISVDQLYRPQPGGIATYVRGLVRGLAALEADLDLVALTPSGPVPSELAALPIRRHSTRMPLSVLSRVWPYWSRGVPRSSTVVHATSMAGPFAGSKAVHSLAMHDLLWRDEPEASTPSGIQFHEARLARITRERSLRIFTTSPGLGERLVDLGISAERIHRVRLGADDETRLAVDAASVAEFLGRHNVRGPFTFYAGTREPRKNLERLIDAHRAAMSEHPELGPLVLAGPAGWGDVATVDAVVVGHVERSMLLGLYRDASIFVYVPRREGWGLPPVEALHAGTRVLASSTTPSVAANETVVLVDPLDVTAIAQGLVRALSLSNDDAARAARRESVAQLTWRNAALDHLAGWQ
ncbi:MAG: glycosyltransferase [Acidimicrobiales bacterium]